MTKRQGVEFGVGAEDLDLDHW